MSYKVQYITAADEEMFPFAPGSAVVVRDLPRMHLPTSTWERAIFVCREGEENNHCFIGKNGNSYSYLKSFTECYPIATHGHLIGTAYSASTPACARCGKVAPAPVTFKGFPYCGECVKALRRYDVVGIAEIPVASKYNNCWECLIDTPSPECPQCVSQQKRPLPRTKENGTPLQGLCATCYVGEVCKYNGEYHCASYVPLKEAAPTPEVPSTGFQPFQHVLVRNEGTEPWKIDHFARVRKDGLFACASRLCWRMCIAYEGNEHLVGTTDSPQENKQKGKL